ncbi:hypothetical protein BU16DRAFT_329065 [Lophium mytilinum]|uniref:Uncharacterized protein n=1 Tax=Lophium mytilinum TaxID=390894 RepID=A0A6A6R084_9PEZI|nr:hypothetical protein BU16DRAFT_329065 [Lophium mytilinum]
MEPLGRRLYEQMLTFTSATLTATAYITSTSVYLHTETSTSFATTTPVLTETLTIQATETTTTTSTKTVSVCPSATYGISGIAVSPPGQLRSGGSAQDAPACCSYCYNTPGCNGWAFLGANYCFAAFGAPPNTAPDSTTCPNGLGTYELGTGGPSYLAGGAGPCAST